jgi:16S rRNA (cytosine967-C5)-methyltransferase
MQDHPTQVPLWRQLQGAASLLMAVRDGQSMTAALEDVDATLRPGVQSLGFHVLRWLGRAEALRQQLAKRPPPPEADALLCVALALGWSDDDAPYTTHTLVDQTVEAAKRSEATRHQASFINACLRRFLRERDALVAQTEKSPQAVWNHPQWWIDQVRKDHPAHWQAILQANNSRAPLILRVNERKTTQAQYLQALAAINIEASPVGKNGVILAAARPVTALPGFAEGHFSVQDAAAQLAAPLLLEGLEAPTLVASRTTLPPEGAELAWGGPALRSVSPSRAVPLRILDACAAPGGKTAHLLELADCEVTALDIDARRCERIAQNLQRLGLHADIVVGDAGKPDAWWEGRLYDGILLDAPCTASGIVRRHPDVRWLRRPTDIDQLAGIQAHLLKALWPLLKPGGRLLYCTCSVFRAEGENQIQTFLAHHTDALLMPSPGHLLPQSGVAATVFPDNLLREHDGFYYALLEKRSH